ncbi:hypothetical protein [Endozoicomonas euniceicola]|uniref:Uncharacterized protein n=1 Tax=Endozoicomonas euniceicola TaxID=1234143 RepID=A0ABY6GZK0_9GAMM|nr:hypothetical protein [Endozoicomonas euniceicola]UYM18216.1 hypothetical protein NX720_10030 [Endozoicomonas euniceicola]
MGFVRSGFGSDVPISGGVVYAEIDPGQQTFLLNQQLDDISLIKSRHSEILSNNPKAIAIVYQEPDYRR